MSEPDPVDLVEDACQAVAAFMLADGNDAGRVRVLIGALVVLEYPAADAVCRLP